MSSLSCARRAAVPTRGRPAPAHPSGSTNGRSFQPIPASHFAILGILPRLQRVSSASMSRMASRTAQGSGSARRSQSRSHSRHASSRPCCTGYADQQDRNPSRCGCPSRRGPPGKEPDEEKGRSALWGAGCPARSPAGSESGRSLPLSGIFPAYAFLPPPSFPPLSLHRGEFFHVLDCYPLHPARL